jgi:phosphoglycolate phosphatase-like HAD superfamily hydrolase
LSKAQWVVLDLDSTLANTDHRADCIPTVENGRSWWDYADRCKDDTPIEGARVLAQLLHRSGLKILILTARPSKAMDDTRAWLKENGIPYDDLWMAGPDVKTSSGIHAYKVRTLTETAQLYGREYVLAVDDSAHAEEMYAQCGIPCLTVMSSWVREQIIGHSYAQGI